MIEARSAGPTTGPGEGRLATNTMIIFTCMLHAHFSGKALSFADSCFCLKA